MVTTIALAEPTTAADVPVVPVATSQCEIVARRQMRTLIESWKPGYARSLANHFGRDIPHEGSPTKVPPTTATLAEKALLRHKDLDTQRTGLVVFMARIKLAADEETVRRATEKFAAATATARRAAATIDAITAATLRARKVEAERMRVLSEPAVLAPVVNRIVVPSMPFTSQRAGSIRASFLQDLESSELRPQLEALLLSTCNAWVMPCIDQRLGGKASSDRIARLILAISIAGPKFRSLSARVAV